MGLVVPAAHPLLKGQSSLCITPAALHRWRMRCRGCCPSGEDAEVWSLSQGCSARRGNSGGSVCQSCHSHTALAAWGKLGVPLSRARLYLGCFLFKWREDGQISGLPPYTGRQVSEDFQMLFSSKQEPRNLGSSASLSYASILQQKNSGSKLPV